MAEPVYTIHIRIDLVRESSGYVFTADTLVETAIDEVDYEVLTSAIHSVADEIGMGVKESATVPVGGYGEA
ncbi:MAG TPA: hypothetical protein VIH69_05010 [Dehalococcoidia bacterium]